MFDTWSKHPVNRLSVNKLIERIFQINIFHVLVTTGSNMSDKSVTRLVLNIITNVDSGHNSFNGSICVFPTT